MPNHKKRVIAWFCFFLIATGCARGDHVRATPQSPHFDVLIVRGEVVDGQGGDPFRADVAIREDRIAAIGNFANATADLHLDAQGLLVAPGFIDMHSHVSFGHLLDPRALSKISQGITLEIEGEGVSVAPLNRRMAERQGPFRALLRERRPDLDWQSLDDFLTILDANPGATNFATYVGTSNVRELVIGYDDRPATAAELAAMELIVDEAMRDGALGIYSALSYSPDQYNRTTELIAMARVAAQHGGLYQTHPRSEGDALAASLEEIERILREGGLPVHITHIKAAFTQNWGRMTEIIAFVERLRGEGLPVTADIYPYERASGELTALLPPWAQEGGRTHIVARLADPDIRARIRAELTAPSAEWENEYFGTNGGPAGIMLVGYVGDPEFEEFVGLSLREIADRREVDPRDVLFDLIAGGYAAFTSHITAQADIDRAIERPWVAFGTDGAALAPDGPLSDSLPHPRAYGAFPRVFSNYVRGSATISIGEFVRRAAALPASILGIQNRGVITEGNFADIVVFDANTYDDRATYEEPHQLAVGVKAVLVNGQLVFQDGHPTGARPGRVIRGPGYSTQRVSE